ncbi:ATPase, T2SS/T4P/T4SS family, partial [Zhongshania sp.]|uniref:ATPase, T2SS/T4P/T4SS family n=1 Tax=Zhongshania sp. TaxID=1971902 RepID=UPI003567C7F5
MSHALTYAFARSNRVLVEEGANGELTLLCCKQTPPSAIAEVQRVISQPLIFSLCEEKILQDKINETFQRQQGDAMSAMGDISSEVDLDRLAEEIPESQDLLDAQDDAPVIRLINALFGEALKRDASDIHIETYEKTMSVRLRVDGILQEVLTPSRRLAPLLVSRIKVMSRLDIAEKRV